MKQKNIYKPLLLFVACLVFFFAFTVTSSADEIFFDEEIFRELEGIVPDMDIDYDLNETGFLPTTNRTGAHTEGLGIGFLMGALVGLGLISIVISIASYVYFALAYMSLAKKTKTEPAWLAWVPIANLYLISQMAKMHWWPILLILGVIIPVINVFAMIALMVFTVIWDWKIFERVGRPGWWAITIIIPIVGWITFAVLLGVAAWGKSKEIPASPRPETITETEE